MASIGNTNQEICGMMTELRDLTVEIDRMNAEVNKLRKRKTALEQKIDHFLQETDKPGVRYRNMVVVAQEAVGRVRKKKSEKLQDCMSVLRNYGITNTERVLAELENARKGAEVDKRVIKLRET